MTKSRSPCLDLRPFLERDLHQVAGRPWPDVHRLDRLGAAGEIHELGDSRTTGRLTGIAADLGGATWARPPRAAAGQRRHG